VFQTEKLLKEQAENVSEDERQKIEEKLKALKDALAGSDIDAVKRGHEELLASSQEFAQRLYQQAAQSQQQEGAAAGGTTGPGAGPSSQPSDDEVADAEIVEDDDQGGEQKGA
jgi:molecular chaperone DnaK